MFLFSGIFACVFLGGYNILPLDWAYLAKTTGSPFFSFMVNANYWLAPAVFLGKCSIGFTFYVWLRATLPRLRYDQLMSLGWKTLLPVAVANFILVGFWLVMNDLYGVNSAWASYAVAAILSLAVYIGYQSVKRKNSPVLESRTLKMVDPKRSTHV